MDIQAEHVTREMCVQIRSMGQFEKLVEINIRSVSYQRDSILGVYDSWSYHGVQLQPQVRIKLTYCLVSE